MRVPGQKIKSKTVVNVSNSSLDGLFQRSESRFYTGKQPKAVREEEEISPRMKPPRHMARVLNNTNITLSDLIFDRLRKNSQVDAFYYLDCLLSQSGNQASKKSILDFTIIPFNGMPQQAENDAYVIAINDRSFKLEMQKLEEVNLFKNRLLGFISHEVNTPLNVIFLIVDALRTMELEPKAHKLLSTAIMSARILSYVMKNLEWYSKIMSRALQAQPKRFDLNSVVVDVASIFNSSSERRKTKILFDVPDGLKLEVYTDQVMLEQTLFNLISNASKYTEKGFIYISIREEDYTEEECKIITLTVSDTGTGISKDSILKLGKFFEKAEADDGKETRNTGLGIGLAVSNMLAKALWPKKHEGITVESVVGLGSSFSFRFPSELKTLKSERLEFRPNTQLLDLGLKVPERSSLSKITEIKSVASQLSRIQSESDKEPASATSIKKREAVDFQKKMSLFHGKDHESGSMLAKAPVLSYTSRLKTSIPEMKWLEAKTGEDDKELESCTCSEISFVGLMSSKRILNEGRGPSVGSDLKHAREHNKFDEEGHSVEKMSDSTPPEFILVVDDNEFNLIALDQILKETGFKIQKARNGAEAIELLEERCSNGKPVSQYCRLILMDINMPVMDGITCTERLKMRMISGTMSRIPIIANSANIVERQKLSYDQDKELFDDIVPKPINKYKLLELTKTWIEGEHKSAEQLSFSL